MKVYKQSIWAYLPSSLFIFSIGCVGIFIGIYAEEKVGQYIGFVIALVGISLSILFFLMERNLIIILNNESITLKENKEIKIPGIKKKQFTQIKWSDIIAVYMVEPYLPLSRAKSILVFPKANTGNRERDEAINLEVKSDKKSSKTKAYIHWLMVNKKGIKISKWIKGYRDLVKEICKMAPQAVIDEEIRKLIEELKNEKNI